MESDWKCAITTAILSVLIYLIIVSIFSSKENNKIGKSMSEEGIMWHESVELIMLVSVFIGFTLNGFLFQSCRTGI